MDPYWSGGTLKAPAVQKIRSQPRAGNTRDGVGSHPGPRLADLPCGVTTPTRWEEQPGSDAMVCGGQEFGGWHTVGACRTTGRLTARYGLPHGETAKAASLPGAPPTRSQVHGAGGTWKRPMRPAPPGGLHRPAGSQPPPPVVRMRRSTGPRMAYVRPVPGLGVVVEATPALSRAALGLPFDSVRRWLLWPRQRGSGSWARRRLGGEAEGMAATPEAVYPRCHRGPERRCPQPRSSASRGRCASSGTRPRSRARPPGAVGAERAARNRGSRPPAKDPHAAAS